KPVQEMVPRSLPPIVENKCDEFVKKFVTRDNRLPQALLHDGTWKESDKKLVEVVNGILETL
ncbi:8845_t:CDS:1, partial [Ambispora gerdemannii]